MSHVRALHKKGLIHYDRPWALSPIIRSDYPSSEVCGPYHQIPKFNLSWFRLARDLSFEFSPKTHVDKLINYFSSSTINKIKWVIPIFIFFNLERQLTSNSWSWLVRYGVSNISFATLPEVGLPHLPCISCRSFLIQEKTPDRGSFSSSPLYLNNSSRWFNRWVNKEESLSIRFGDNSGFPPVGTPSLGSKRNSPPKEILFLNNSNTRFLYFNSWITNGIYNKQGPKP